MVGALGLCAAVGAWAQTTPSAPQPFIEQQRQQDRERALREQQERAVDVRLPTAPERSAGRLPESEIPCFRIDRLVLEGERAEDFQWLLSEPRWAAPCSAATARPRKSAATRLTPWAAGWPAP
jgi:hemolysin activation/secretion protein